MQIRIVLFHDLNQEEGRALLPKSTLVVKKALVPIANGSEEIEAVTLIDVLRRAGIEVCVASVEDYLKVTASRGVVLEADCFVADSLIDTWGLIALPGGMPGAERLGACAKLTQLITKQQESHSLLAAVCAAPAVILGRNHLIKGYRATCHPSLQDELARYATLVTDQSVVSDRNLITSQGPGTSMLFALTLVSALLGDDHAKRVAKPMLFEF